MTGAQVDLNSDLGESFGRWTLGEDAAMLPLVTSANIACGFHAGDPTILRRTCADAVANDVAIGAQVSYRDLAGFGRRFIDVPSDVLTDDVIYQIGALEAFAKIAGTQVRYVKPHGALYNATVHHRGQAEAVVSAVRSYNPDLPILGLPGSELLRAASEAGSPVVQEFFADRGYTDEGTLVSRSEPGALLHDASDVAQRVVRMVTERVVTSVNGVDVAAEADSICVHGDSPGAVEMATAVRQALLEHDISVLAFA